MDNHCAIGNDFAIGHRRLLHAGLFLSHNALHKFSTESHSIQFDVVEVSGGFSAIARMQIGRTPQTDVEHAQRHISHDIDEFE